jgi:Trypsin-co-occurring domain 2
VAEQPPTLGELIMQLRRELGAAQADDPENPIRFGVGPVELETTLAVTRAQKGNVGLVLRVLSLGGEKSSGDTNTTRVRLTLTPTDHRSRTGKLEVAATDTEPDDPPDGGGDG